MSDGSGEDKELDLMMYVRDVMTRPVVSVGPATPLKEVATVLVDHRVSGVPVVDRRGRVAGVVTEADFLIKARGPEGLGHRRLARFLGESGETRMEQAKLEAITAGEAMTAPAITIGPNRRIAEAAALMTERRINRLPVVEGDQLVGIVTRADLVRAYVRSDEELCRAITDEVLFRVLWLDPARFEVHVEKGVATIRGQADRRSTAAIIGRTIAMLPGIVDVVSHITWERDDTQVVSATLDDGFPFVPR